MVDRKEPAGPDTAADPAAQEMFVTLYRELHALAERHLRRNGFDSTLTATSLLHETYLNLAERERARFPDEPRFLAYASKAMRGLIIDYARARRARKRGGQFEITNLGDAEPVAPDGVASDRLDSLGLGLERLSMVDPDLAQLVDLHFFCGMSFVEIAAMRGVSDRTVQRDWKKARMLLQSLADPE